MGFDQVVPTISLTVGSELSATVLLARTPSGRPLPDIGGFEIALVIAAALCQITAVDNFALPGQISLPPGAFSINEKRYLKARLELTGTALAAGDEQPLLVQVESGP